MAITSSQVKNSASVVQVAVGSYITSSTAAAFDITIGFKPLWVRVVNETSGDMYEWYHGMAAAEAVKTLAAGTRSIITTLGITQNSDGFTVGLDTDVNVINEQLSWMAVG